MRLLPLEARDGAGNMAADETLLRSAVQGVASLRFYTWSPPTLSLGYFQPAATRWSDPRLFALPFVRRPSGGQALVHHHELTYCLALPHSSPLAPRADAHSRSEWTKVMHGVITEALLELGVEVLTATERRGAAASVLCFHQITPGDLLCLRAKVVGSSQRKHRGCLLQHGGILLAASPHAPSLPGIEELTAKCMAPDDVRSAVARSFATTTASVLVESNWTAAEQGSIQALSASKYTMKAWNEKR